MYKLAKKAISTLEGTNSTIDRASNNLCVIMVICTVLIGVLLTFVVIKLDDILKLAKEHSQPQSYQFQLNDNTTKPASEPCPIQFCCI